MTTNRYTEQAFSAHTAEQNSQALADLLPTGDAFDSKNINDSNLRKFLLSMSAELTRFEEKLNELSVQYYIPQTTNLIDEWESALGIPDSCLTNQTDITIRREQATAKLFAMNIQLAEEFVELAAIFGIRIKILYGEDYGGFPMIFPFILGSKQQIRFTMIVKFLDLPKPTNVFPLVFPFTFGGAENVIKCLVRKLAPANVFVRFVYMNFPG